MALQKFIALWRPVPCRLKDTMHFVTEHPPTTGQATRPAHGLREG